MNKMNKKNFYLGIDLGTTNSSVAYGPIDAYRNQVMPEVIMLAMRDTPNAQPLVPSVVTYDVGKQSALDVGLFSKDKLRLSMLDPQTAIIKSVKLQMGQANLEGVPWLTPEKVSSDILKFLKAGAEKKLLEEQNKVVIGVPACFDTDMWAKTKKAAEMAGFNDITLIDEPKAALLDFIRDQERFTPESRSLDFSQPKIVCVFDPGGGTIDVSIVKVNQVPVSKDKRVFYEIHFEDLGLTRQPFLGGDDFDNLLSKFLEQKFFEQNNIKIDDIPDDNFRSFAKGRLVEFAEAAKKNLTYEVENLKTFSQLSEKDAMGKASTDVTITYLFKTFGLNYHLSYREYNEIISPLLGYGLSLNDINSEQIRQKLSYKEKYSRSENIIMPIYDALIKAEHNLGYIPAIDALLISGGMSKLPVVRRRLKDFFGENIPMIEAPSPDLSVSRGAVIHHYNTVHGLDRITNLLPEAICLEVGGNQFLPLIPANTKYPTSKPIIPRGFQLSIPRDGIPFFNVPLWRGEPPQPTEMLDDRTIDFRGKPIKPLRGDVVELQATIDSNRQLKLEAWLQRRPDVRFEVVTALR